MLLCFMLGDKRYILNLKKKKFNKTFFIFIKRYIKSKEYDILPRLPPFYRISSPIPTNIDDFIFIHSIRNFHEYII